MRTSERLLIALCSLMIAAGLVGIATHRTPVKRVVSLHVTKVTPTGPSVVYRAPGPVAVLPVGAGRGPSGPSSSLLQADMLTPTDMGGYYRIDPASATATFQSATCLAGLSRSPRQSGWADTALLGPNENAVPTIVEVVASYPGSVAEGVFQAVSAAVQDCPSFPLAFRGASESVHLSTEDIAPVGNAESAWQGTFGYEGRTERLQVGVVLDDQEVVAVLYVDAVPPSDAIMGSFPSTLSAILGKLA